MCDLRTHHFQESDHEKEIGVLAAGKPILFQLRDEQLKHGFQSAPFVLSFRSNSLACLAREITCCSSYSWNLRSVLLPGFLLIKSIWHFLPLQTTSRKWTIWIIHETNESLAPVVKMLQWHRIYQVHDFFFSSCSNWMEVSWNVGTSKSSRLWNHFIITLYGGLGCTFLENHRTSLIPQHNIKAYHHHMPFIPTPPGEFSFYYRSISWCSIFVVGNNDFFLVGYMRHMFFLVNLIILLEAHMCSWNHSFG